MQNPAHARWGSQAGSAAEQAANLIIALRRAQGCWGTARGNRARHITPFSPQHQHLGLLFVWVRQDKIPVWVFTVLLLLLLFFQAIHLWGGLSPSLETRIYLGVPFEKLTTCSLLGLFQGDNKTQRFILPVGILVLNPRITSITHSRPQIRFCTLLQVYNVDLRPARHHTHAFSTQ